MDKVNYAEKGQTMWRKVKLCGERSNSVRKVKLYGDKPMEKDKPMKKIL